MEKKDLKPAIVFRYFEEVCQVPRPSKKEEKIRAYLLDFAQKHNLACKTCFVLSNIAFSFSVNTTCPSSTATLIEGSTNWLNSPLGPFTVTTLSFRVTVTPAGILMGNFPILDIAYPPINIRNKELHHQFSVQQLLC